jgi:hypothetical protein
LGAIAPPIARLKMQTDGRKMKTLAATEQKWGHPFCCWQSIRWQRNSGQLTRCAAAV